jgi:AcrB/AcrD/AcrF family
MLTGQARTSKPLRKRACVGSAAEETARLGRQHRDSTGIRRPLDRFAAKRGSWTLPLAVILVVPMCLLSSITGVLLAGSEVNLFTQIGFVVLVGLASKNAILIVEFTKQRQEAGVDRREVTLEASRLRLRPILMASFAFISASCRWSSPRGLAPRWAARWAWPCSAACSA